MAMPIGYLSTSCNVHTNNNNNNNNKKKKIMMSVASGLLNNTIKALRIAVVIPVSGINKEVAYLIKSKKSSIPKYHFAVYVGEQQEKKRYAVPVSYLNENKFRELLSMAEQEFGFDQPEGLTIPCTEDFFIDFTSRLQFNLL
ncbi:auxin-responsive protein SAUR21-like [Cannabis sativa]|uniref:auxin-responsive protein SAUR21-like n=1 Tax=Cannabis sativa TaxID=3483 RepID=UPI0029CA54B1|nr:auxin-responsive protein SAUR21-like [Cannabis sativa]